MAVYTLKKQCTECLTKEGEKTLQNFKINQFYTWNMGNQ